MHAALLFVFNSALLVSRVSYLTLFLAFAVSQAVFSAPAENKLNKEAELLKQELIKLNQDLSQFEQSLLYPPEVQVSVFLSLSDKTRFRLDSIEILIDDALVASHLYQEGDINALKTGGIQQLYLGSVNPGKHKLSASFNGQGRNGRYFRKKKSLSFTKNASARFIQLIVSESPGSGEPQFKVKQW